MSIDRKAFYHLSYGLFLLTAQRDGKDNGCIINTAIQAASDPKTISICCIKGGLTQEMIDETGVFNLSVLPESTPFSLFQRFGMQSGRDADKLADYDFARTENGLICEQTANAMFSCKVVSKQDLGSHMQYVASITEAIRQSDEPSITYAYYQDVTKKQGAAAAETSDKPVAQDGPIVGWRCTVCGYLFEGAVLPEDFICPICKHGADVFEPVYGAANEEATNKNGSLSALTAPAESIQTQSLSKNNEGGNTMKWVCKVCGYIFEGEQPPAECPVCHASADKFEKVEGELTLAAEHEYGIYAKTVKDNPEISAEDKQYIFDQLKANFNGECSEVGMYLCMARIAHREGYPEIGLYWEKAAYEEAEHAAKFAELLGEDLEANMKASTKENLAWRVECEFGATAGKFELASCAKKNGLDAIHDTVHEMARDEARHGKALKGLLERYF